MGIGLGFGIGPLRVFVPLRSRRRRQSKRQRSPHYLPASAILQPSVPEGWYPDPKVKNLSRYWDGSQWTSHTIAR